ncbi:MAG: ankyrin repeat domain-containing protein [Gemmatimonadales bacterium]
MTLAELFAIADGSELAGIEALRRHPHLATAVEVAGDYQQGEAAPALVHAAHRGQGGLVEAVLDLGGAIDCRGLGGGTALHVASWCGHAETVRVLIARGAPLDLLCEAFGATPLGWAAHGFGPDGCFPKRDHCGAAVALLDAGADPEIPNAAGERPIDLVASPVGNPMRRLLERHGSTV